MKAAAEDPRTAKLVLEIRDIDYLDAESEIDALLMEARLIKDILPKFNRDLRDDKTFPYLEIFTHEDFPRVRFTREPKSRGTKLYGPFANPRGLRGAIQVLQKIFKFRTCTLDIDENDPRWRWFRPCLLHSIGQCTAPCNLRISKEQYRKDIRRLQRFLEGGKNTLLGEMREEMAAAAEELHFEEAARLRDEIEMIESLDDRGELETHVQPEVFPIDPKRGLAGLAEGVAPRASAADDRGHRRGPHRRHRHRGGGGAVYRRAAVQARLPADADSRRRKGPDDVASIHEAVARRFHHIREEGETPPDILLIDGGRGQLHAALAALGATAGLSSSDAGNKADSSPTTLLDKPAVAPRSQSPFLLDRPNDGDFPGQARGTGLHARRRRAAASEPPQLRPAAACNTSATRPTASPSTIITCCAGGRSWVSERASIFLAREGLSFSCGRNSLEG